MYIILLVILILLVIGGLPHWGYAQNWGYGYYPSGLLGIVLVILLVLFLTGRL